MRALIKLLSAAWLLCGIAHAEAPDKGEIAFRIEPQSMPEALNQFAHQSGYQLLFQSEVARDLVAPRIVGNLKPEAALQQLLANTGLSYRFINEHTVTIRPAASLQSTIGNGQTLAGFRLAEGQTAAAPEQASAAQPQSAAPAERSAIEEIVVTAQKREERLIEVPMSITALSGDELNTKGIDNVRDLSYAVPGLSVLESGPGRQIITIRGIAGQRGTSSLTGLYLDEMPISGVQDGFVAGYADVRTIDLDRVEVLKGPQGTLFGEGAAGGVIRFITKDPDLSRFGGDVLTEFYSTTDGGGSGEVTGVLNVPLAKDVFGIRIAAKYENIAGWIDQPTIGKEDINDSDVKHVRVKALWAPTPELRIKGMAEIHRNEGGASNIINQYPLSDSNFRQAVVLDAPSDYRDDYDAFNLTVTYDFSFAQLVSSTSHSKMESMQSFTQRTNEEPIPYFEAVNTGGFRDAKIVSQEFRLTSTSTGPFNWTMGAQYKDSDLTSWNGRDGVHIGLFGGATVLTGLGFGPSSTLTSKSLAGFADGSYKFANRLELGAGLRYFTDERESFGGTLATVLSGDFHKTTGRVYLKYGFHEDANVYLSVGTGFRSGGLNGAFAVSRGAPPNILPENTLFYELGTKLSVLGGRLRFDGAIFYGEYQDMMQDRSRPSTIDQIPVQYTANGQSAELKGVEWSIGWAATDRLTFTLAGDVTDTEIVEVDPADPAPVYYIGDPISLVPDYTVTAAVDYGFNWSDSVPGAFRIGFDRKGKAYNTTRSTVFVLSRQSVSPEVDFLSASLEAQWNGWRWSLFGRNLLDEESFLYPTESGWSAQARPRTIGVSISKSF